MEVVYTDGSGPAKANANGKAGFAVVYATGPRAGKIFYGSVPGSRKTNIRAEAAAIIAAIENSPGQVEIRTDSMFWIDMVQKYMPGWIKRKVDFATKANPDLTVHLWKLVNEKKVRFVHVKAHTGGDDEDSVWNAKADEYAEKGKDIPTTTGFYTGVWN